MKYVCTIIIVKENKHMNVSYNVQNNYEECLFNEIRDTKQLAFWLLTWRLGISKIMSKTIVTKKLLLKNTYKF